MKPNSVLRLLTVVLGVTLGFASGCSDAPVQPVSGQPGGAAGSMGPGQTGTLPMPQAGVGVAGIAAAGTGMAGIGASGTGVGGIGVAGTGMAGIGMAGIGMAGIGMAGIGMAGIGMAGIGGPSAPPPMPPACLPQATQCAGGKAGKYACKGVTLLSHVTASKLGGPSSNDVWGWTDPMTQKEYALVGMRNGTSFVDISDPCQAVVLGHLKTRSRDSTWRDIKVYKDHAFIVSEASGHGMQVFDLTQLRNVASMPATFTATTNYDKFAAHNIGMNAEIGHAYGVGVKGASMGGSGGRCGALIIDVTNPTSPQTLGCFSGGGHDIQCVNYKGPDAAHQGKSICVSATGRALAIHDVTDPKNVTQIASTSYPSRAYAHQGWFTEDQRHFLLGDEQDEGPGQKTRTYIWDMQTLSTPKLIGTYKGPNAAIDHNLYIRGNYAFQANYTAGMRVVDLTNVATGMLAEVAFFDSYPSSNAASFGGVWSLFPYFRSGVVILTGPDLWVLYPQLENWPPVSPPPVVQ